MYKISIDPNKNRLYLTLGTLSSPTDICAFLNLLAKSVKRLRHGFTCVSDYRNYKLENGCKAHFMQDCQEILWEAGITRAIRICRESNFRIFPFERKNGVWPGYTIGSANSIEEAEALLDLPAACTKVSA